MEQESVPETWMTIALFRKIQIGVMLLCFGCSVLDGLLEVHAYAVTAPYEPLAGQCGPGGRRFSVPNALVPFHLPADALWTDGHRPMACPCRARTCVPKCCPTGESFPSADRLTCAPHLANSTLSGELARHATVYYKLLLNQSVDDLREKNVSKSDLFIFPDRPLCAAGGGYRLPEYDYEQRVLMEDGSVLSPLAGRFTDIDRYCMELVNATVVTFTDCVTQQDDFYEFIYMHFPSVTLCMISLACTLITLLVYSMLSPLRQSTHGKIVICYLISISSYDLTYLLHVTVLSNVNFVINVYYVVGTSEHFWLTCLCYDLWSVFSRPLRPPGPSSVRWRVALYSAVCWGLPCLLHALRALDAFDHHPNCRELRFSHDACERNRVRSYYLAGDLPLLLLAALNMVLFLSTLVNLRLLGRQTAALAGPQSHRHAQDARDGLRMYVRLALVMGLPAAVGDLLSGAQDDRVTLGTWFKLCSSLLSPFVLFVVLVCNKRIFRLLRAKVCSS